MLHTRNFVIRAFVALALAAFAGAQTAPTTVISPSPILQFWDLNGKPLAGGQICVYAAGTTTPVSLFKDAAGTVPWGNPIVLDSSGRAVAYAPGVALKYVLRVKGSPNNCANGNTLYSVDNIQDSGLRLRADLTAPTGAAVVGYNLGATGSLTTTVAAELRQHYELKADFGAAEDGATNDSAALRAAMLAAGSANAALHASFGTIPICGVRPWASGSGNTANVTLYGDGPHATMFVSHASCQSVSTNSMIEIFTSGNVNIHDIGIDSLITSNGSSPFIGGADIAIHGQTFTGTENNAPASVSFRNNYVAHGTIVGFQCQPCQNVTLAGNTFYQNWWVGASIGSGGNTGSPNYLHGFTSSGNLFQHSPIGLEFNFLVSDISESADTFTNSSLYLTQMPNANYSGSALSFDGAADYGCLQPQCGTTGIFAAIYNEGSSHVDIGGSYIGNVNVNAVSTGIQGAIVGQGSKLSLGGGSEIELPISDFHLHDVTIYNSNNAPPIDVSAQGSHGGAGMGGLGTLDSVKNVKLTGPNQSCGAWGGISGGEFEGNYCESAVTSGWAFPYIVGTSIRNNRIHNIGSLAPGTYYGIQVSGNLSQNIDLFNNEITEDAGNSLATCFDDETLAGSNASQLRHFGNKCTGGTVAWNPAPAIPTLGAWARGALIENFGMSATGAIEGWVNTVAGSPGSWNVVGQVSGLTPDQISNIFGYTNPIYAQRDTFGMNLYSRNGSTWQFGAGSSSQYGGALAFDPATGTWTYYATSAAGNADAIASLIVVPPSVIVAPVDPGCTLSQNIGVVWQNTATTTTVTKTCLSVGGVLGWH